VAGAPVPALHPVFKAGLLSVDRTPARGTRGAGGGVLEPPAGLDIGGDVGGGDGSSCGEVDSGSGMKGGGDEGVIRSLGLSLGIRVCTLDGVGLGGKNWRGSIKGCISGSHDEPGGPAGVAAPLVLGLIPSQLLGHGLGDGSIRDGILSGSGSIKGSINEPGGPAGVAASLVLGLIPSQLLGHGLGSLSESGSGSISGSSGGPALRAALGVLGLAFVETLGSRLGG
jgi:hypothetical protein